MRSVFERTNKIAVVGQVAQFNLTSETSLCREFLFAIIRVVSSRVRSAFERTDYIAVVGQVAQGVVGCVPLLNAPIILQP